MMPFSSVAIIEKLALLKIAFCRAPVFSRVSWRRTSVMPSGVRVLALITAADVVFLAIILNAPLGSLGGLYAGTRKAVLPVFSISSQRQHSGGVVRRRASDRIRV